MDVPVSTLDELFDTFLVVQARIHANLEAHAASLGLNASQLLVVRDVSDHPGTTLKDVCVRCGLKKSAASRLIDALALRKMIVRKTCPTSRRAVALELGPALGDGRFCRTTALTKALPGWAAGRGAETFREARAGLEAILRLAETT
jgi:DNA-binding MarR family transcriptional regulator